MEKPVIYLERAMVKTLRQLAVRLFRPKPKHLAGSAAQHLPTTVLRPCSDGTELIVCHGGRGISRIISPRFLPRTIACTWQWLKDCEGNSGQVQLSPGEDHLELAWDVDGFPQSRQIELLETEESIPATPTLQTVDTRLLAAMDAAGEATDQESLRYALSNIQLDGQAGTVTGTDGKQLVHFEGFCFPWTDRSILVPATDLFSAKPLMQAASLACGASDDELVLQADPWTIRLPIEKEGRFPNVAMVLNNSSPLSNRVYLDADDIDFFARHVKQLPGGRREHAPVTLELNGRIELTAVGDEQVKPMRLRMSRSLHLGDPIRCSLNRYFLQRAAKLGATELLRYGEHGPLVCRGDRMTYLVQPLSDVPPLPETAEPVMVDSATGR